jgi:LacI family transcriptional regulator, galactose operon repressor
MSLPRAFVKRCGYILPMPRPRTRDVATIHDVARVAGVSRSTAARALGSYGVVSANARERILAAAEQLDYRANGLARSMITGKTFTLGAVVADIENMFFGRSMRGFADVARKEGFDVILTNTDEQVSLERSALKVLLEKRVDGVLISPASMLDCEHLFAAVRSGVPMVLLDRRVPKLRADLVHVDNFAAARVAVQRLLDAGHRRIGLITGDCGDRADSADRFVSTGKDRLAGYRAALEDAGLPVIEDDIRYGDFHREAARRQVVTLLGRPDRPTAVFATDSVIALGVVEGIQDLGLRIPEDVSVVGFDDADWTQVVRPRLSVVAQPIYEMGVAAAERLISRVRGEVVRPKTQVLPTTWIERESIAPPVGADRQSDARGAGVTDLVPGRLAERSTSG